MLKLRELTVFSIFYFKVIAYGWWHIQFRMNGIVMNAKKRVTGTQNVVKVIILLFYQDPLPYLLNQIVFLL
jgi:hypothetical protein